MASLLAIGSGLVGCAHDDDPRRVVRFWAFGREGEVVRELVPEFERRHPTLRVEVQQVPWVAAHEKLLTAFVGGAVPDAAQLGNTWIPEFAAIDALHPLDPWISASQAVDPSDVFPGVWQTNVVDGATWGLPWYVDTRVLFYRRDLLAAAGVTAPPTTWAEWRAAMARVKALVGPDRYAILLPIDEWAQPVILALQAGSPLLRDGGRYGAFTAPEFRRAMELYVDLYTSGLAPPLTQSGLSNLYQQFAEGYFAMVVTGPWNLGEMRRRLPAELQSAWATAPLPAADDADGYPGVSLAGGASLVIFRDAREPEGAWRWLEYLAEPAQQARFFTLSGDLPARRSAWDAPGLAIDPQADAFRRQLGAVRPLPAVPECERIVNKVAEHAERVMRGAATLDQALADLDREVNAILAKRRFVLDRQGEPTAVGRER